MQDIAILLGLGAGYLVAINAATYFAFAWDKYSAVHGEWRVSEATLLLLALLGGGPAAKVAQRRLRHKTRKQPFGFHLNVIVAMNVLVVSLLLLPDVRFFFADSARAILANIESGKDVDEGRTLPRRFGPGS